MTTLKSFVHVAVFGIAITSGCASSRGFVATGPRRPALPPDAKVTFHLGSKPVKPFEQVGLIEVAGASIMERVTAAQQVARARGANAIVLLSTTPTPDRAAEVDKYAAVYVR